MAPADEAVLSLEISRRFLAVSEQIFDAWVRKEWGVWLPPAAARCEVIQLEARVGGRYHARITMPDGRTVNVSGTYREMVRPEELVLTWLTDDDNQETIITVTFQRAGPGTVMTLRQEGFADAGRRDSYKAGWIGTGGAFDKLARFLTG